MKKINYDVKCLYLCKILDGKITQAKAAQELMVDPVTVSDWVKIFRRNAINYRPKEREYSNAVEENHHLKAENQRLRTALTVKRSGEGV